MVFGNCVFVHVKRIEFHHFITTLTVDVMKSSLLFCVYSQDQVKIYVSLDNKYKRYILLHTQQSIKNHIIISIHALRLTKFYLKLTHLLKAYMRLCRNVIETFNINVCRKNL